MKALTAAEMREVDRLTTERFGVPSLQLMEAAGESVAAVILERCRRSRISHPRAVAVLAGKGNNGGDGLVTARHLQEEGTRVHVYLFSAPEGMRGDAAANLSRWRNCGGGITPILDEKDWERNWPRIAAADVVVDALLGTGLRGPATGLIAQAIDELNACSRNGTAATPAQIVSVDTPSGLPSDGEAGAGPVVHAHVTVTFTAPKIGQLISAQAGCCGHLVVRSIGSPAALLEEAGHGNIRWAGPDEFAGLPLIRQPNAHKGSFGHALLIAGSLGKTGAAILCGRAALYGGTGLVTVATPESVLPIVAGDAPEYMTEPLLSNGTGAISTSNMEDGRLARILGGKTLLGVGPGLGTDAETQEFIRWVVRKVDLPVILDADGLNAFPGHTHELRERKSRYLCITPHPGEMARLLGSSSARVQENRVKIAVDAAKHWNTHVVLKGYHTVLASPEGQVFVSTTGNAGLAKGGSGDVLTGLLAAMTAQFATDDWLRILALGVYLHGAAADHADHVGDPSGLLAGTVASGIPHARALLLRELQGRV